jgi:hypothetical protein
VYFSTLNGEASGSFELLARIIKLHGVIFEKNNPENRIPNTHELLKKPEIKLNEKVVKVIFVAVIIIIIIIIIHHE